MTHAHKPTWLDFYNEGLGPLLPLTSAQQQQLVSGILPSGESAGFDHAQLHAARNESPVNRGSGINEPFPYPNQSTLEQYAFVSGENYAKFPDKFSDEWWEASGIIKTYPEDSGTLVDPGRESGIFHYNNESGIFSNGPAVKSEQIEDFNIFNDFIYHQRIQYGREKILVSIPYISTYRISTNWNPYG